LGLVETENDLGTHGAAPSHPKLLDWLAAEFMAGRGNAGDAWSIKALHRLIATSATYRQASETRADLAQTDPKNRLLARMTRLRLPAELIRDQALVASGLLSPQIGGPSVFPWQPQGVMDGRADRTKWTPSAGADLYRRGMYTHFWRLTPHPFMVLFDAPDAVASCSRRSRSNTATQALTLLNGKWFVECADRLAERVLRDSVPSDGQRIEYAFRLCLGRLPTAAETRLLSDLLSRKVAQFTRQPDQARAIVGSPPAPGIDMAQAAAWREVARVLLNLDEFITRR
jgi:hypothetical protein